MFTAIEKNAYVSEAELLVKWGVLNPKQGFDDFYAMSNTDDLPPLSHRDRVSIRLPEEYFGDLKETIDVYSSTPLDGDDRPIDFEDDWVGMYTPMNSKGKIDLFLYRIRDFLGQIIRDMISSGYPVTLTVLTNMARVYIKQIVYHEYFHHYVDVQRQLYGSYYAKLLEESLAVAWSRIQIEKYYKRYLDFPTGTPLQETYEAYKRKIFNFNQPGYRDWKKYYNPITDEKSVFCDSLRTYTMPSSSSKLKSNGVVFNRLILENLDAIYQTSAAVTLHLKLV